MIGPVKQEDEWDSPHIVRYHDIVPEKDLEKVKELAKPRVSPSVFNHALLRSVSEVGRHYYQRKGRG